MIGDVFDKPLLVLVGPTAIGKTALSLRIASSYGCEIISMDSMQVYRYMNIGTAKVSLEDRQKIPHHLIDIVNPDEHYDAARFAGDALRVIADIHARGKLPLLTGGTGLYLRALLEGIFPGAPSDERVRSSLRRRLETEGSSKLHEELTLIDPVSAERIHVNDSQRVLRALEVFYLSGIPWSRHLRDHRQLASPSRFTRVLEIGLTCDRPVLYERINERCRQMLDEGLEGEVKTLLDMGYHWQLKAMEAIGYRHMVGYLHRDYSWEEMTDLLARDTRRYAKRQYTWFRALKDLQWHEAGDEEQVLARVESWLSERGILNGT